MRMKNTILLLFCSVTLAIGQWTTNSILSEGTVIKMAIPETGLYTLSFQDLQSNTDLDLANIDPRNIHIYGNQGGLLPLDNSTPREDDLVENAVYIQGEDDGSFDSGDYILFYAEGADRVSARGNQLSYEKNIYDFNNYYFLKVDGNRGKRIEEQTNLDVAEYSTTSDRLLRHEIDVLNLLGNFGSTQGSGKQWFGETFGGTSTQDFSSSFSFTDLEAGEAEVSMVFSARGEGSSSVSLNVNGQSVSRNLLGVDFGNVEDTYATTAIIEETMPVSGSINVSVTYNGGNDKTGWLDYIQVIAKERLTVPRSGLRRFCQLGSDQQSQAGFRLNGDAAGAWIWNVTDVTDVHQQAYAVDNASLRFGYDTGGQLQQFIVFNNSGSFMTPTNFSVVENTNIHSIEALDMAIVYHPNFEDAAMRLADHRRAQDGFRVETINIFDIYNEFGGGKADPVAVRDMARMLYSRDTNFKYLLLLGDASYDYRGINTSIEFQNFVPTYETDTSLNPIFAFPTDDFFGLLSEEEGSDALRGTLDLGIGRIPAQTNDEALAVVNKIITYDTDPERFGDWRTRLGFAADDVDASWDTVHARDTDNIAQETEEANPCLHQQKVYFDAFVQEATPGGARYPAANKAIADNIFAGQLVFGYLGHGGPRGLSQERVIQISDVRNYNNAKKLPIFITATCSFTGFDEPNFVSAGEFLIKNPNGGAVSLFTTVRSVFASSNRILTQNVYRSLFERENGLPLRLGDILRRSQNDVSDNAISNSRKFLLMGDPAMQIALPKHRVSVTEFNNQIVTETTVDTLGALSRGKITGQIEGWDSGELQSGFNGTVFITVFDKASELTTLLNDGNGPAQRFSVRKNILYKGSATVSNGEFEADFILPQDINFSFGKASINLYATNNVDSDAMGCYDKIVIGGTSDNVISDNEGPEIDIFFNDRSFIFGGKTNAEPILIVDLADENGINLSSTSIGHDITATLEDQNGTRIVLNEFYEPTVDKIGEGTVTYQMPELEEGPHKLYLKAWDILNNSSEEVSEFYVANSSEGFIENVFNYPNPFSTSTNFTFEHDLINTDIEVIVSIYTISGKLVKSIVEERFSQGSRISDIHWDAKDDYGNRLAKGIYLYKIKVYSPQLNVSRESDFRKMAILH